MNVRGTMRAALLLSLVGFSAAHAMEGVPTSVAEWAHGARLFEGLPSVNCDGFTKPLAREVSEL